MLFRSQPKETIQEVMGGLQPKLLMDIHTVSEVNKIELSELPGPATSEQYQANVNRDSTKTV